ncbi:MAG: GAF domain-containing protein [Desulfuromonadales bacterium]|nr:GAF domain-containing protein [Desulfuromonadales bacterium]
MTSSPGAVGLDALLLIEHSPGSLDPVREACPGIPLLTLPLPDGISAPDLISRHKVAAVICDLSADDPRGLAVLQQIRRVHPWLPVVMALPEGGFALALEAFRAEAADVIFRPLDPDGLQEALARSAARTARLRAESDLQQLASRSLDDLVLLKTIGATTGSEENLPRLLERVVAAIQTALKVEIVSLMLCDDDGLLEIRAARGLPAEVAAQVRIAPGDGVAGFVLASGEAVLIDDLASDGRFPLRGDAGRYRSGSLLSVPIRTQERVVGVLNVNNKKSGASFTAADQELLAMIAHQAALAIENLKLVGRLQEQSQELEQTHADLLRLHHDRTRFVCSLSHELKTPLTSILGFADLLVNFFEQIGQQELREYLGRIHDESLHLERLISGMLRLFAIDSGSEHWQWAAVELPSCINEVLTAHDLTIAERDLTVELKLAEGLAAVWADRDKLLLLLDALIENAVKFNRDGGGIRIHAENREINSSPYVYLAIANDGRTVLPEQSDLIFQHYSQLGDLDTDKPCGVGIGLAICRAILRQMQGWIFLEAVSGEGTCLGLLLPDRPSRKETCHAELKRY